jgi:nucleoside-diphosphate-sugar epimerase
MQFLITGSKGLIGSALRHSLKQLQLNVIGMDIREPISSLDHGDLLNRENVFSKVSQVDGVIHLAAVSRVIDGEKNPSLCWETNFNGTQNIIDAALASKKKPWVIYASSREVYGQQKDCPVKESSPLAPVNIYGRSKAAAEEVINLGNQKGLKTAILRFSNVFGSVHDHTDRVVPAFCRAAAEGKTIRVDGENHVFDFTYIEDVIQGILSLIQLLSTKNESVSPIHLTKGIPVTLGDIARIAQKASHYPIEIVPGPIRSFDVSTFWGDTNRASEILNWKACVPVEEGMNRLINQYRLLSQRKS